ncbi:beta-ketoacyl synthase chain length factor [Candidatus Uabimicrobium amorphum]|uniref:3-oxoacyl-[acyl-carrier-protein] synthase 2 n=1 Tax=Uabimicrobium amorphum TaxID=2596890 RepID=A0A5S9IS47_UABAM|nr:beta-ketoacyl synthase chain length factor [Candidatus Uabimicrobium amorphum]BBM86717.1 3-oxoacyl-[acyl-carrier-protein] synthase 2 [Candidatus Uabimicrobium amorphum]
MHHTKISIVNNEIIAPSGENYAAFTERFFAQSLQGSTERSLQFFNEEYAQHIKKIDNVDTSMIPSRLKRRMSFLTQMMISCATKCLQDCAYDRENLGVIIATGWGELETTEKLLMGIIEGGDVALSPTQFHNSVHNTAAGYLGIMLKVKGPTLTISQENHSLEAALAAGHLLINSQQTQHALVGGVDTYFRFSVLDPHNEKYPHTFGCGASSFLLSRDCDHGPYLEIISLADTLKTVAYASQLANKLRDVHIDMLWLSGVSTPQPFLQKLSTQVNVINNAKNPYYPTDSGMEITAILATLQRGELPDKIEGYNIQGSSGKIRHALYVKETQGIYKSFMIWV